MMTRAPQALWDLVRVASVVLTVAGLTTACGPRKEDSEVLEEPFSGLQALVENADGSYTLNWNVAAAQSPRYLVFRRGEKSTYEFSKPHFTTSQRSYTTESLLFQERQCFIVRASTENLVLDENEKELCTSERTLSFRGLTQLTSNSNGHVLLTWAPIAVQGIKYAIYSRRVMNGGVEVKEEYSAPLSVLSETTFDAGRTPRGDKRCFRVALDGRDSLLKLPSSLTLNTTTELCTEYAPPIGFDGIESIDYAYCAAAGSMPATKETHASDKTGITCSVYEPTLDGNLNSPSSVRTFDPGLLLAWRPARSSDAVGFQIFEGPSLDGETACVVRADADADALARFSRCVRLEPGDDGVFRLGIGAVSAGRIYHFGVQAIDRYGNGDGNTLSIPVRAMDIGEIK